MATDFFRAILAMDAYNRGYDVGLVVDGNSIGVAQLGLAANSSNDIAVSFLRSRMLFQE